MIRSIESEIPVYESRITKKQFMDAYGFTGNPVATAVLSVPLLGSTVAKGSFPPSNKMAANSIFFSLKKNSQNYCFFGCKKSKKTMDIGKYWYFLYFVWLLWLEKFVFEIKPNQMSD